ARPRGWAPIDRGGAGPRPRGAAAGASGLHRGRGRRPRPPAGPCCWAPRATGERTAAAPRPVGSFAVRLWAHVGGPGTGTVGGLRTVGEHVICWAPPSGRAGCTP